jgi:Recombination endonuclease VII
VATLTRDGLDLRYEVSGYDHEGMLARIDEAVPSVWPGSTAYPERSERGASRTGTLARIPRTRHDAGQPGRIAQWWSTRLTSGGSQVRTLLRPPFSNTYPECHWLPLPWVHGAGSNRKYRISSYGLTQEQFDLILTAQNYACGMCREPFEAGQLFHVDHDHGCCQVKNRSCGKCVRGLLCHTCNIALSHIEHRYALARAYLDGPRPWAALRARSALTVNQAQHDGTGLPPRTAPRDHHWRRGDGQGVGPLDR